MNRIILYTLLAILLFFLLLEHRAHVYGALPYLLLLACPLMHFFHGHGKDGNKHRDHQHGQDQKGGSDDE